VGLEGAHLLKLHTNGRMFTYELSLRSGGRKFALTRDEFFAIVPDGTQPGDVVCIFFGAQTPFVLRASPKSNASPKGYQLVGECYVHGIMEGEMINNTEDGVEQCVGLRVQCEMN
jgi:hypothetical protein